VRISLNGVEFDVEPVAEMMRLALLSDPIIAPSLSRAIYRWDAAAQAGKFRTPVTQSGAAPLPNGMTFFIPKAGPGGMVVKNEDATRRMAARFLTAVGLDSVEDAIKTINTAVNLPQKTVPLGVFERLNPAASYDVIMQLSFDVVRLRSAAEDISAYLFLPGRVSFHHEVKAITNREMYDQLVAEHPQISDLQCSFVVPSRSKANAEVRKIALRKRLPDLQSALEKLSDISALKHARILIDQAEAEWAEVNAAAGKAQR
jgi:hypothetical protein